MKKCTPLWHEAHFQVKIYKTPQRRTTFGSCNQWLRSAIPDSQQPISPIGFLFLKLPPPPCAVLLVQQKTERRKVFPKMLPRENETTVCMRYMRCCHELQVKLGKAQENQEVPEVLGLSSL